MSTPGSISAPLLTLTPPPPTVPNVHLSLPRPHILLVTLSRPRALNAIPTAQHLAMAALWEWYDAQLSLRCAILTGAAEGRAFCAGADLKEWDQKQRGEMPDLSHYTPEQRERYTRMGFGGLSNRHGKKPVIAAVNGLCFGGGMEMVVNCDLVVADGKKAKFGLPEVKRGVVAVAGALPRVVRTVGLQRANELALLGRTDYTAEEMRAWGVVNFVVPEGKALEEALKVAEEMVGNSPDSVITTREGLRLGWQPLGPVEGTNELEDGLYKKMDGAENMKEGLRSFVEKREPRWVDSKL
ncbi:hypothetical protein VTJ04DRAFT_5061 [Mycothermus thermophilus]|uniref:uncharacterized protein n=1 Tax=Humicola insolens TaxID=85995 RepID=UPI0037447481